MFDPIIGAAGPITQVREGMDVRDSGGEKVGTIKRVQMGGNDPVDGARQAAEAGPTSADAQANSYNAATIGDLLSAATGGSDGLPNEVRQNLERKGFIEIGGGLFSASRYATADQIAEVAGDDVTLNVAANALIKG